MYEWQVNGVVKIAGEAGVGNGEVAGNARNAAPSAGS
jgi:hypothetical protein